MLGNPLRSPYLSAALFVALVVTWTLRATVPPPVQVVGVTTEGPDERPTVFVEFDAPMAPMAPLAADLVRLEPAAPVKARFETPRRLRLEPVGPLPRLRTWQVRFGPGLAALDGRPVTGAPTFTSGTLCWLAEPVARVRDDGVPVLATRWSADLATGALVAATRLTDERGRAVPFRWSGEGRGHTLALDAMPGGPLTLELAPDLRSMEGGDPLGAPLKRTLVWSARLDLVGVEATEGEGSGDDVAIDLAFSHPLAPHAPHDLRDHVAVTPRPADLVVRPRDGGVRLTGAFPVGETVAVTVRAGLRTASGLVLAADARRTVRIPTPSPFLRFSRNGSVLSTHAAPVLEVTGRNVADLVVEAGPVPELNLVPLALGWRSATTLGGPYETRSVPVVAAPHRRFARDLDLGALFTTKPRGAWHVRVADAAHPWRGDACLLQLTDLAPVVRVADAGLVVSVAGLADGDAVPGARVTVVDAAQRTLAEGRTDAAGLCLLHGVVGAPVLVVVRTQDDVAWVHLDEQRVVHTPREVEGRALSGPIDGWVRADRGLVRPGETLHVVALLRTLSGDAVAEGLPVVVTLLGPDRRTVRRVATTTPTSGLLDVAFLVPEAARTGTHTVTLCLPGPRRDGRADPATEVARTAVRVEPFVPDRIEARIEAPPRATLGSAVPVRVVARTLAGDPAPGRAVRLRLEALPLPHAATAGHERFTFGDPDAGSALVRTDLAEGRTDDEGVARLTATLPALGADGAPTRVVLTAEVVDLSGRAVTATASLDARPGGVRLGVALPEDGEPSPASGPARGLVADVVAVGDGPPPGRVTATLERIVVRGAWSPTRHGALRWTSSEVVETVATATAPLSDGRAHVAFADPGDGAFRLRVSVPARDGGAVPCARRFARSRGRMAPVEAAADPLRLSLRASGPARAGDTLPVTVRAPFAGRLLLTVEAAGLLHAHVVSVEDGPTAFDLPLPALDTPSLHVTATLSRGDADAADGPIRLLAALALPVERPARTLAVRAHAPAEVVPEAPMDLRVEVSSPADVVVALVDGAILARTRHPDADPAGTLFATRRLATRCADAFTSRRLGARYLYEASPGGDEGDAVGPDLSPRLDGGVRLDVETVALCSRRVAVEREATLRFDVPAFEGRLRWVVVAANREALGSAAGDVVVRGPVGLAVFAPLCAAPGDTFDVRVEARGDGVTTALSFEGLARTEETEETRETQAAVPGAATRVRALPGVGLATVTAVARDRHGVAVTRRARVAVRPAAPLETTHTLLALAAGETRGPLPGDFVPATRRATVWVGTGPATAWRPALERLRHHPHACAEQTTSRAFAALALAAVADLPHPDGAAAPTLGDEVIGPAIDRLLALQTPDGGLAVWPGQAESDAFASAYGAHFLVEAGRLGRAVPPDRLGALLDGLARRVRSGGGSAYEAYVLSLAGRDVGTHLDVLADRATSVADRAHLSAAAARRGDLPLARMLLDPTPPAGSKPATPGLASPATRSSLRTDAVLLDALLEVAPDDPRVEGLVTRLAAALLSPRTTQEDAWILRALARHAGRASSTGATATRGPARGRLTVGDRSVEFTGGAFLSIDPTAPWTYAVTSDAPVQVVVRVEGVPVARDDAPRSQGIAVTRRIVGAAGGLKQGQVVRVEVEGVVPSGSGELLVADVLPGGLAFEASLPDDDTLRPDRVERRDDRLLLYRSAPLVAEGEGPARFRYVYLARAVAAGTFRVPSLRAELLYDPEVFGESAGGTLVVSR